MENKKFTAIVAVLTGLSLVAALVSVLAVISTEGEGPIPRAYQTACYSTSGGDKWVCASGGEIEIQSGATLDLQSGATTGFDAAMDFDSTLNVDGAVTLNSTLDTDGAVTLNSTLDVDGNISSGTGAVTVTDSVNITGAVDCDSTLNADSTATVDALDVDNGTITLQNDEVISNSVNGLIGLIGALDIAEAAITPTSMDGGEYFTPTNDAASLYIVNSSGAVSMTLGACSYTGQVLFVYGDDANNVTVNDTNLYSNDGSEQVLGQYDLLTLICIKGAWVEISDSNNS